MAATDVFESADPTARREIRVGMITDLEDGWSRERGLLEANGYACAWLDPMAGLRAELRRAPLDAVIVDWDLTGCPAADVLTLIRAGREDAARILVVAASPDEVDVAAALERGADDYLTKPASGLLLLARLKAALRAAAPRPAPAERQQVGPYAIDRARRTVTLKGRAAPLTAREFDLACLLFDNIGRPLSRAYVLEALWGYRAEVSTRTLDTHISRVRTKLGMVADNGAVLSSHYGFGYQLDLNPASRPVAVSHR